MFLTLYCPNLTCNAEHRVAHYLCGLRIWCTNCTRDFGVPAWPVEWLAGKNAAPPFLLSAALEADLYRLSAYWLQHATTVWQEISDELDRHTPTEISNLALSVQGVIAGILWKGFATRQDPVRRLGPIPVMTQIRAFEPLPVNRHGLESRYLRLWAFAYEEWRNNLRLLGEDLVPRP